MKWCTRSITRRTSQLPLSRESALIIIMAPSKRFRQTDPSSRTTIKSTPLSFYQAPSHPLNVHAQRAFHEVFRFHRVDGLQTHLTQTINNLIVAAGDINDRSQQKFANHQKRKIRRLVRDGVDSDEEKDDRNRAMKKCERMSRILRRS